MEWNKNPNVRKHEYYNWTTRYIMLSVINYYGFHVKKLESYSVDYFSNSIKYAGYVHQINLLLDTIQLHTFTKNADESFIFRHIFMLPSNAKT